MSAASLFSHVTVGTNNLEAARAFYDAVLKHLGGARSYTDDAVAGYSLGPKGETEFWVVLPFDDKPATVGNGIHVAFNAPSRAAVDAFHAEVLALGGSDEGAPGPRPHYHADYYGAYVRDLDGNKLQAVCHKPE